MPSCNIVFLVGHATRDAETREAGGATRVSDCFFAPGGESDFSSVEQAHRQLVDQVVEVDEDLGLARVVQVATAQDVVARLRTALHGVVLDPLPETLGAGPRRPAVHFGPILTGDPPCSKGVVTISSPLLNARSCSTCSLLTNVPLRDPTSRIVRMFPRTAWVKRTAKASAMIGTRTPRMPSVPKRAVTVAPLPSPRYLKLRSRTFAAASTIEIGRAHV